MRAPLAIALSLTLFATRPCHADARECIADHEAGIAAKEAKKPLEARPKFAACTRPDCPAAVREECAAMVEQLDRQIPSVVIAVKDPDQRDLDRNEEMFLSCYASDDYKEGIRAFAEKRKPVFTGK